MSRSGPLYTVLKRAADIIASLLALVVTAPLFLVLAIWVKLDSPGPVLYRARRVGRRGIPFDMLKLRSMVQDADKIGPCAAPDDDPRITRSGRFLRRSKLDEVPQFVNVLLGQMSIVGPRPEVARIVEHYTPEQRETLEVQPGLVDYASLWYRQQGAVLEGSTDPEKDYMERVFPTKMALRQAYVQDRSLWVDLKIALASAGALFAGLDPSWCLPSGRPVPAVSGAPESRHPVG